MLMINLIAVVLETHNFRVHIHQIEHDLQKLLAWLRNVDENTSKRVKRQMSLKISSLNDFMLSSSKNSTNHETVKIAFAQRLEIAKIERVLRSFSLTPRFTQQTK